MNKYVIKFSHVEESKYTAIVEAESYEEVMNIFEKSPFGYAKKEEPESRENVAWNVSEVTENSKVMYENSRQLIAEYR